ncbi:hypothetical protein CPAR01_10592 [Colletotrichum paranaense]|uniref:Ankyrin repeat protein n=1 Tax=Colletotrichum paranaense TaxID=1914294 RepID=A0ABQ9SEJ1_9PEZI|nr:uncharacterized protein CPAR01_10592 [Colletotrichum paranaense]KAK1533884.1 hypothetical protein CPAR01_10592 [Colletotrichum paranaense]
MDGRIARLQGAAKELESWVGLGCLVIGWCICVRPVGWFFLGVCVGVSGIGEAGVFCRLNKSRADDVEECHLAICRLFFARRLISSADSDFDKQNSIPATAVPTMVREVNTRPEIRETEARRRELAEVALAVKPEVYGSGVDAMLDRQLQELVDNHKASGSGEISKEVLMDPKPREAIDQGWVDVGDATTEASLDTQGTGTGEREPITVNASRAGTDLDIKLHEITAQGSLSEIRDLLQQGANPNTLSAQGTLPLCEHARRGNMDAVKSLLDHEADINLSDASGRTAISYAAETTNPAMARLLMVVPGIDVNLKDSELRAPVWYALCAWIKSGRIFVPDTDTLFVLLEDERVRVGDVDGEGRGLLHLAAAAGAADLVEFLCGRGDVDVNRRDGRGRTAVAYALGWKDVGVLGVLLKYGAGITVVQGKGFEVVSPRRRRRWVEGRWCYARIID